ncbi:ABC-three component system middle component 6 [Myceligenerans halotolerans]
MTIGSELLDLLRTPKSVSALWEQYAAHANEPQDTDRITFDWFSLALASLFAINLVQWTPAGHLRRANVR